MLFRIREIREIRNYNKSQLAKKAGISKATISKLENYKESPTIETLEKIAKALDVKVSELLVED
ncbi:helix-turn-helix domain-containing protein [Vallitalea guaymasensis]|uniref:Helix-turn-helix transcriptional regulator n=1 Tax=Vallitalea guaymasensis TaxID=1185412 RepID=A0A8J8SC81_9FIRM|nr:helix-turn-helix transcriptional regulator [Vallitalea guaymasensis]QUH29543.1 helix-turn-helix transcriptional regulator [Vallitalea guaymasensis]